MYQRQIDATDEQINALVYALPQGVDGGGDQDRGGMTTDKTELNGRSPAISSVESVVVRCPKSRKPRKETAPFAAFASFREFRVPKFFAHVDARISNWHAHARRGIMFPDGSVENSQSLHHRTH